MANNEFDKHIKDAVLELEKALGFYKSGPATYGRMCSLRQAAKQKFHELDLAIQQANLTARAWQDHLLEKQTPVT